MSSGWAEEHNARVSVCVCAKKCANILTDFKTQMCLCARHFSTRLQFLWQTGMQMLDTKGDTEETQLNYFFCGSTIGVFELYVASFETMHIFFPDLYAKCSVHSIHPSAVITIQCPLSSGLNSRSTRESVTSSITSFGRRMGDQPLICIRSAGVGGGTQTRVATAPLCSCGPTWASAGTLWLLISAPSLTHSLPLSHLSHSPLPFLICSV